MITMKPNNIIKRAVWGARISFICLIIIAVVYMIMPTIHHLIVACVIFIVCSLFDAASYILKQMEFLLVKDQEK